MIVPSSGTISPGGTRTFDPTGISARPLSRTVPSSFKRNAFLGLILLMKKERFVFYIKQPLPSRLRVQIKQEVKLPQKGFPLIKQQTQQVSSKCQCSAFYLTYREWRQLKRVCHKESRQHQEEYKKNQDSLF